MASIWNCAPGLRYKYTAFWVENRVSGRRALATRLSHEISVVLNLKWRQCVKGERMRVGSESKYGYVIGVEDRMLAQISKNKSCTIDEQESQAGCHFKFFIPFYAISSLSQSYLPTSPSKKPPQG
jgi:hypothetical protein